jgi:hypothetical protein
VPHVPASALCPPADAADREAAHTVACHPEQGWSLLCNGVVAFEDTGVLLPGGRSIPPHRSPQPGVSRQPCQHAMSARTGCRTFPGR